MDILARLFGFRQQPPSDGADQFDDPDFGTIWRCSDTDWEGESAPFPHTTHLLPITTDGDSAGPSTSARKLLLDLHGRYLEMLPRVASKLKSHIDLPVKVGDLTLRHILIGGMGDGCDMQLTFDVLSDAEHRYTASIKDWIVVSVASA